MQFTRNGRTSPTIVLTCLTQNHTRKQVTQSAVFLLPQAAVGRPPVGEPQPGVDLVLEGPAIDGLPAPSGARRVSALYHELFDDAVEDGAIVVALHAQLCEVAHCLHAC